MTLTYLSIFGQPVLIVSAMFFLAGALLSLVFSKNSRISSVFGFGFAIVASILALVAGLSPLFGANASNFVLAQLGPLGSLSLGIDNLSALFVSIIAFAGITVSIYSFGYIKEYVEKGYEVGRFAFLYNLFLLSMILVVCSDNALLFLIVWEIMALSSFFLVTYEHKEEEVKSAGFNYLLITHIGAIALTIMFLILAGTSGSLNFSSFSAASYAPIFASAIFLLALIGFGSKCGIMPLHIWLPLAHPQAPSNVSALMSGVMLKVAIYGIIRVLFGFLGIMQNNSAQLWWALLILGLGMLSSVFGALYSLLEKDLKRLLAMSSIENIGIIFIGIGAAVFFSWANLPLLAALALFAALYHTLNHSLFKTLLFLGAGSVAYSTHERNMDKLGGLAKFMPFTAVLFLVAVFSIAAIPPLNGFVSEMLTFQALLGGLSSSILSLLVLSLAALFLALTSALAFAVFVKAFGISFQGAPRSSHAANAKEVPQTMLFGMSIIVFACIAAGAFPVLIAQIISGILASLSFPAASLPSISVAAASLQTPVILLLFVVGSILVGAIIWFIGKNRTNTVGDTWGCGFPLPTAQMQYSSAGFSMPIARALSAWIDPLSNSAAYGSKLFDYLIYDPISRCFKALAPFTAVFQSGKLGDYLMYLMITLALVLLYALMVS